jgi:hypothetical protein
MSHCRIPFLLLIAVFSVPQTAFATVKIHINLSTQTMRVSSENADYVWPISSARSGYSTPRGYYRPQHLERMHYSHKYHMSPMPHSIFFRGGYAIHGTYSTAELGQPASHGCIRLAPQNAAMLYAMVQEQGGRISIEGSPPATRHWYAERRPRHSPAYAFAPYRSGYRGLRSWLKDPAGRD